MSITLTIPDFALVTLLAEKRADALRLIEKLEAFAILDLNVNQPREMKATVFASLDRGYPAVSHLVNSHAKARSDLARWAKSAGATSVVIRIGNTEAFDPTEKHDHLYEIAPEDLDTLIIERTPMAVDLRHLSGPFDIIGDIHGCARELFDLLIRLGHAVQHPDGRSELVAHPEGRRVCLVGDLTDRGPMNHAALEIAYQLHQEFGALVILGNHDFKLLRWLRGANVTQSAGLQLTVAELEALPAYERDRYADWLASLTTHFVLDHGRLVIAHAGLAEQFHGLPSKEAEIFALYGEKSGQFDMDGFPLTRDWAAAYHGTATVVHGHTVTHKPRRLNNVISIDTGCVFGGELTAYRYPEGKFVAVPARAPYFKYRARVAAPAGPMA